MQNGCVYVIMLKIALVLVKIYVLMYKRVIALEKKGISELLHWIAQKHTADVFL